METNITEYIIENYRKEDLMRAYQFNIEKFGTQVIDFFPIGPKEKLAEINHYEAFMQKMKDQGIEKQGHLAEINDLVGSIERMHLELKQNDTDYFKVYEKAMPYIDENLSVAKGIIDSEVQICLNGVYGYLLLKIEERIISDEEQKMIDSFGNLLSLISFKYNERKNAN